MIVCSCRGISDRDYKNEKELIKRLQQKDRQCCSCLTQYSKNVCKQSDEVFYERDYEKSEESFS